MPIKLASLCLCMLLAPSLCGAQSTPPPASTYTPTMTFDVASVKHSKMPTSGSFTVGGGFNPENSGNLTFSNFDIANLLCIAYGVDRNQT